MRAARLPGALLAAVLVVSFGLHAHRAAHPSTGYQSADERAYGKLAVNLADQHHYGDPLTRMREPLHWPPGAPFLFAAGDAAFGSAASARTFDIPAAYWEQAVVSTGTAALAAALGWMLAGAWTGLAAGALVGTYPPLILATGEQLSEPLGAFLLLAAFVAVAAAVRRSRWWWWAGAGALFGLTALTRADLLPVPFLVAGLVVAVLAFRRRWRRAVFTGGSLAGAAVVVLLPWTLYASLRAGQFVPVTKGSASALFVGTYLPGNGTTVGMKRALAPELKRRRPGLRGDGAMAIDAQEYLALIAARHPELPADRAISREGKANVARYLKSDPIGFGRMMLNKVVRMWSRYARGGARHTSWAIRAYHIVLVLAATLGLLLAVIRRRTPVLAAVGLALLYSTAIHLLVVSQARYNLPLMPALLAGGVAGWWLALRPSGQSAVRARPGAASTAVSKLVATSRPSAAERVPSSASGPISGGPVKDPR